MALPLKQDNCLEQDKAPAEIVPMPTRQVEPDGEGIRRKMRDAVQQYAERATDPAKKTKDTAQGAYEQTKDQTARSYARMLDGAQDLSRRTQARLRQTKEENPLQLLAVIAGAAFVLGVALRIWRSRTS